jgi:hypothetical protein
MIISGMMPPTKFVEVNLNNACIALEQLTSQPLRALPSQLPKPGLHAMMSQATLLQVAEPTLGRAVQLLPQVPHDSGEDRETYNIRDRQGGRSKPACVHATQPRIHS